ncbi:MAG: TolC family protein, partial [Sphingomonadales bacterium]|nr:TolC family protein [Sphingomonadales bacterium]
AQSLRARVKDVIVKAESALAKARQIEAENLQPALTVLKYQQSLLDIIRQLDGLNNDMNMAATELKTLLNLPPSVKVGLGFSDDVFNLGNAPLFDVNKMEDLALANRPELYEADYMERIHSKDVRKAMLNMLPGLSLTAGGYFDDNQFAYNNNWNEFGAFFSWNLVDLATGPRRKRHANMVKAAAKLQRLALSVAIISQVRLAEQNFTNSISALKRANEIQFVSEKIAKHTQAGSQSEQMSELKEIQSDVNAIYTELRQFQSYALYQNAMGRVFSSMGLDPVPSDIHKMNLEGQSAAIEARFSRWERGELPEANIVR